MTWHEASRQDSGMAKGRYNELREESLLLLNKLLFVRRAYARNRRIVSSKNARLRVEKRGPVFCFRSSFYTEGRVEHYSHAVSKVVHEYNR